MSSAQNQYVELLRLTKAYLLQEYKTDQRIFAESSSYHYFRQQAIKAKTPSSSISTVPSSSSAIYHERNIYLSQVENSTALPQTVQPESSPTPEPLPSIQHNSTPINSKKIEKPSADKLSPLKAIPKERNASFILEPLHGQTAPIQFTEMRKIAEERLPYFHFMTEIPEDKKTQVREDSTVAILAFNEPSKQQTFLSNIAKALELQGEKVVIIQAGSLEEKNSWNTILEQSSLRLIIASVHGIETSPYFKSNYKESAKEGKYFLKNKPLLLLSDLSLYMKEPKLKKSLWEHLKVYLKRS